MPRPDRLSTADVAMAYLAAQVDAIQAHAPGARRDAPDAVHQMRVATRRLRSALATYRPVLDRSRSDPLRDELRWLGAVLGAARDGEVLRDRLADLLAAQPPDLVGPVGAQIIREAEAGHRGARAELALALDSVRYQALLDHLARLVADPPLTKVARRRADRSVPELVDRTLRRVDRAATAAESAEAGRRTATALHEVRKAAKRARYAAESATPIAGKAAKRLERRLAALQQVLGDHQDSVSARQALREIGKAVDAPRRHMRVFDHLRDAERVRADSARARYPVALAAASDTQVRRWTKP